MEGERGKGKGDKGGKGKGEVTGGKGAVRMWLD